MQQTNHTDTGTKNTDKDLGSEIGRGQIQQDFIGQDKDLALYFKGYVMLLNGFEHSSGIVRFVSQKDELGYLVENE